MLRSTKQAATIASRPGIFESDWPSPPPPPPTCAADGTVAAIPPTVNGHDPVAAVTEAIEEDDEWNNVPHASDAPVDISEWATPAATVTVPAVPQPSTRAPPANNHFRHHHRPQDDPRFRPAPLIPVTSGYASTIQPVAPLQQQPNGAAKVAARHDLPPKPSVPQQRNQHDGITNGAKSGRATAIDKLTSKITSVAATTAANGKVTKPAYRSSPALPASLYNANATPAAAPAAAPTRAPARHPRALTRHNARPPQSKRQRVLLVLPATLAEATADMAQLVQLARSTYNDPHLTAADVDVQYAWLPPGTRPPTSPPPLAPAPEKPQTIRMSNDPTNHRLRLTNLLPHVSNATIVAAITPHLPAHIPLASYAIHPPATSKKGVYVKSIVLGFHTAFQVKHAYAWLYPKCPPSIEPLLVPSSAAAAAAKKPEVHWITPRPRSLTPAPMPAPQPADPTPLPAVTLANIDATAHKDDVLDVLFGDQPADLRPVKVERLVVPVVTDPPTLALRFAFETPDKVGRFVRAVRRGVAEGEYVEVTAPGMRLVVVKVEGWDEPVEGLGDKRGGEETGTEDEEAEQEQLEEEEVADGGAECEVVDGGEQSDGGWPAFEYLGKGEYLLAGELVGKADEDDEVVEEQTRGRKGSGGKWVGREVGVVG